MYAGKWKTHPRNNSFEMLGHFYLFFFFSAVHLPFPSDCCLCLSIFQLTFASINFVSRPPAWSVEGAEEQRVYVWNWSKQTKAEYRRMMNVASIVCDSFQSFPLSASRCPSIRSRLRVPGTRSSPAARALSLSFPDSSACFVSVLHTALHTPEHS